MIVKIYIPTPGTRLRIASDWLLDKASLTWHDNHKLFQYLGYLKKTEYWWEEREKMPDVVLPTDTILRIETLHAYKNETNWVSFIIENHPSFKQRPRIYLDADKLNTLYAEILE